MQNTKAVVEYSREVTKKVWVARFNLMEPPHMDFAAGQYCSFRVQDKLRRTFSIASSPGEKNRIEICADISPMGLGSQWIMKLKPGEIVDFMAPLGKFVLDDASPRKRVFFATGTGIAPLRAMVYETLEVKPNNFDTYLVWGLRFTEDIFWNDEFVSLANRHSNFHYELTLSKPDEHWKGKRGYVTDHIHMVGDILQYDYYLCGNHDTIDKIKEFLLAKNIPAGQVKTELFH